MSAGPEAGRSLARSWVPWIALALVLAVALVVGATGSTGPANNEERVYAVAATIRCPTCAGESVAESNAELSKAIRLDIAKRVEAGQTDEQIRAAYVAQYDPGILLTPPATGVAGLVWVLPVVALVAALAVLAAVFRRWQRQPVVHASDADVALVADALDDRQRHREDAR